VPDLRDLTFDQMLGFAAGLGEPRYRGEQLFRWVHGRGVTDFAAMTNLGKGLRAALAEQATLTTLVVDQVQTSADGTRKLRLLTDDGHAIESVLIPDGDKLTQCISSQVGCPLGCRFCATARLGFTRNLAPGEIVDQVYRARALLDQVEPGRRLTNLVYMGMGEPLLNYDHVVTSLAILTHELGANLSQRRITVSTAGVVPALARLGREAVRPNLAISLNAASDEVRRAIMPIGKKYDLASLLAALRAYPLEHRRRITFEYVLLAGVNDRPQDAERLAALLAGFPAKLNLIPWNPHPGADFARPSAAAVESFQNRVKALGLPAYLRAPRGDDIAAACGQLAGQRATGSGGRTGPV
jgi:23S rRNA (adenine2503-C2)-methyltransferase